MSERWKTGLGLGLMCLGLLITGFAVLRTNRQEPFTISGSGRQADLPETGIYREGTVRVNEADSEELTSLYGVGETLAAMIIGEREQNGPFRYPEDLTDVKGIGPAKLAGFRNMLDMRTEESGEE